MYRACELSLNLDTDLDDTLRIYSMFLETVRAALATDDGAAAAPQVLPTPKVDVSPSELPSAGDAEDSDDEHGGEDDDGGGADGSLRR